MRDIPPELLLAPFTRSRALELGVTSRMLDGQRFERVHPRVYRARATEMSDDDIILAARLALPGEVHLTGITRIQRLGLDFGPRRPIRFVIEGDHHLALEGIFLHRTKRLPPLDDTGVTPEAAFIAYCQQARVIDAIKVGDWLLHQRHMDLGELIDLAQQARWRDGADETLWVSNHLHADSRSLMESETRSLLTFAGLPEPDVNKPVDLGGDLELIGDLVYRRWRVVVEYEGGQHQEDRRQYVADLDRYALFRDHDHRYVQVTKEHTRSPRSAVRRVHRQLLRNGYDGPEPQFGELWNVLFARLDDLMGPHDARSA